ncbi:MAG: acyl-CoA thioesterase [Actinobacteria bacterium]|nr:MAG: acyl-CoA thioesterase [Actinomycetota bacterium]
MDMHGHLNQAVYHELLEEGRGALFLSMEGAASFPFVLVRVELDYRQEVRKDHGSVDVVTRVERVGSKSITIGHEIVRGDGVVAAEGRSVLVAWDPRARGSREPSDDERAALLP